MQWEHLFECMEVPDKAMDRCYMLAAKQHAHVQKHHCH